MTDNQSNKLRMYLAVQKVLGEHAALWNSIQALNTAASNLNSLIEELLRQSREQQKDHTGFAQNKEALRDELEQQALKVAVGLTALATANKDLILKPRVQTTPSDLSRMRETALYDRCNELHLLAQLKQSELQAFFVSAEDINKLQVLNENFKKTIPEPRTAIGERKLATASLADLYDETDELLNETIDDLVGIFQQVQPGFYGVYTSARLIVDAGKTGRSQPATETTV